VELQFGKAVSIVGAQVLWKFASSVTQSGFYDDGDAESIILQFVSYFMTFGTFFEIRTYFLPFLSPYVNLISD
jgi:hypothetical protein